MPYFTPSTKPTPPRYDLLAQHEEQEIERARLGGDRLVVAALGASAMFQKSGRPHVVGAGLIGLGQAGRIGPDSTVLYAHLGGQPALNAYSALFR